MSLENFPAGWLDLSSCYSDSYEEEMCEKVHFEILDQFKKHKNSEHLFTGMSIPRVTESLTAGENDLVNSAFYLIIFENLDFNVLQNAFRKARQEIAVEEDLDLIE